MTVWFLGDSLFFPGPKPESSIPAAFRDLLASTDHRTLRVLTSPGLTSVDGVAVFRHRIRSRLARGDLLVLSLGMNDAVKGPRRSLTDALGGIGHILLTFRRFMGGGVITSDQPHQVGIKESESAFSYLLRSTRSRRASACVFLPLNPLWVPRGQGSKGLHWMPDASVHGRATDGPEREGILDLVFAKIHRLTVSAQLGDAEELVSCLSQVGGFGPEVRRTIATIRASLLAKKGEVAAAASLLEDTLEEIQDDPVILQRLAVLRAQERKPFQGILSRALDLDDGLPRLTTDLRQLWTHLADQFDAPIVDLVDVLCGNDVLDHCHPTEYGAKKAATALARACGYPIKRTSSLRSTINNPHLKWEYPRIDYSRARGKLKQSYGIDRSQKTNYPIPTLVKRLLNSHPGIARASDIPPSIPAHEATRFPHLTWAHIFKEVSASAFEDRNWFSDLCPPLDMRLFPDNTKDDLSLPELRGADIPILAKRLAGYMDVTSVFSNCVFHRLATVRRWYPIEVSLFGGASSWLSLLDRQDLLIVVQCVARLLATMEAQKSETFSSVKADLSQTSDQLVSYHKERLSSVDLGLVPHHCRTSLNGYSSDLRRHRDRMRRICFEITSTAPCDGMQTATKQDYYPRMLGTLQIEQSLRECRQRVNHEDSRSTVHYQSSFGLSDTMYPLF